jgi:hypothetical protein
MSCALSYAEHGRSLRPSSLLNVFLLVSLLLDAALLRTLWMTSSVNGAVQAVFTASFSVKAVLVVLEAADKSQLLLVGPEKTAHAPEETSGLYGRALFAWVWPLLTTGFRRLLAPGDLFVLDAEMKTARLGDRFWAVWNNGEMYSPLVYCKNRQLSPYLPFFFVFFLAARSCCRSRGGDPPTYTLTPVLIPDISQLHQMANIASSQAASSPFAGLWRQLLFPGSCSSPLPYASLWS